MQPRKTVVLLVSADKPAKTEEIEEKVFKKINIKMGEEVFYNEPYRKQQNI